MANGQNTVIQSLMALKNKGKNPNQVLQLLLQRNPQARTALTQIRNMANGKSPQEFLTQLAKQQGLSQNDIDGIRELVQG